MSMYWDLLAKEPELVQKTYEAYKDVLDLAIESWEIFLAPSYFVSRSEFAVPCMIYKTQSEIMVKQAIDSILRRQHAQAVYNLRVACENVVTTLFAYAEPTAALEFFKMDGEIDAKIRKAANAFLVKTRPDRSEKLKGLHKMCDAYGAHQSLGHMAKHISFDDKGNRFTVNWVGEEQGHFVVGLAGICVGLILEFHFTIKALPPVEWLKVTEGAMGQMQDVHDKLAAIKCKYIYLWNDSVVRAS